jgi:hypothetical protein
MNHILSVNAAGNPVIGNYVIQEGDVITLFIDDIWHAHTVYAAIDKQLYIVCDYSPSTEMTSKNLLDIVQQALPVRLVRSKSYSLADALHQIGDPPTIPENVTAVKNGFDMHFKFKIGDKVCVKSEVETDYKPFRAFEVVDVRVVEDIRYDLAIVYGLAFDGDEVVSVVEVIAETNLLSMNEGISAHYVRLNAQLVKFRATYIKE